LDRDGGINKKPKKHDYAKKWSEFKFLKNAVKSLAILRKKKIKTIIVSNQRGIKRKLMIIPDLNEIHQKMRAELKKHRAEVTAIYICPHVDEDNCNCRKPKSGMFFKVAANLNITLKKSYIINDAKEGVEAGKKAGCKTILVLTDNEKRHVKDIPKWRNKPDYIARNLFSTLKII